MIDKEKLAELLDWVREQCRYGPRPTIVLPSELSEYRDGLQIYCPVVVAYGIDRPMIAFEDNPVRRSAVTA